MSKKRQRAAQREIRRLQKLVPTKIPPRRKATEFAARLMGNRNPLWEDAWSEITHVDSRLSHLQSLLENPYSEALVLVAFELRKSLSQHRETLLERFEYRPASPRELYTSTSFDHTFL